MDTWLTLVNYFTLIISLFNPTPVICFSALPANFIWRRRGKVRTGRKRRWMTLPMSMWIQGIHEWSEEGVDTFLRSSLFSLLYDILEKWILESRYNKGQLKDKKSREDVVVLISTDGKKLSEVQVKTWVENLKNKTLRSRETKRLTLKTKTKCRTVWHCRRTEGNSKTK